MLVADNNEGKVNYVVDLTVIGNKLNSGAAVVLVVHYGRAVGDKVRNNSNNAVNVATGIVAKVENDALDICLFKLVNAFFELATEEGIAFFLEKAFAMT